MQGKRLFERIRDWDRDPARRKRHSSGHLISSVVDHLKKILNSKQGTTLMDPLFGMPDFTDLRATFPDSVRDLERTIARTVEYYEPRLKQVDVDFMDQDERNLTLYFQIRAVLGDEKDTMNVCLQSTLDAGGKMAVR